MPIHTKLMYEKKVFLLLLHAPYIFVCVRARAYYHLIKDVTLAKSFEARFVTSARGSHWKQTRQQHSAHTHIFSCAFIHACKRVYHFVTDIASASSALEADAAASLSSPPFRPFVYVYIYLSKTRHTRASSFEARLVASARSSLEADAAATLSSHTASPAMASTFSASSCSTRSNAWCAALM